MKILINLLSLSIIISQNCFAGSIDTLNLTGSYDCKGYDLHDHAFKNLLIIIPDIKNSKLSEGYGAYSFTSSVDNKVVYAGSMAANGNVFAMTFTNVDLNFITDRGTIIGTATHDQDQNGTTHSVLHTFYYEPNYHGGSYGTAICIKHKDG